ncbi:MAG: monovalent cation/H+ antiporter subunit D family protein [Gammaproteobacteria bacterium]|nr:monovalent cation/H+ antiporter subunit D family protein [Gammaproteobacteria bacterium]
MHQHVSILLVVIPLLAAPLAAMTTGRRIPWIVALLATATALGLAAWQAWLVMESGPISYALGGWTPPWGIEYRIDALNAFVALLVAGIGFLSVLYAYTSISSEIETRKTPLFYTAFLLCMTGLLGITQTGDVFNVFVFLEISSLSAYALISLGRDRRSLTAAFTYLIMGTIGATFLLIGIGLVYAMTGTLNMADILLRIPEVAESRTIHTAFAFIVIGICLKLALFPLHLWLPNAYTYAPSVVTVFLASTATKVAVYTLVRFMHSVFGYQFSFENIPTSWLLVPLATIGLLSTSMVAIGQRDVKRMLAYSSVAQIGYMVLGIGMATGTGLVAAILHVFNHGLMKGALFMALGAVAYRMGSTSIESMRGLGRQMPLTMAAFVVGGLSLIGVPLTVGFISKWYLILAAVDLGWWPVVAAIVIGSLLAVIYIWRVVEAAYFQDANGEPVREAPLSLLAPTWILIITNIWFGIDTRLTVGMAERAVQLLTGAN